VSFVITNIKKEQKKHKHNKNRFQHTIHLTIYTSKIKLSQQINQLIGKRERKEFPHNISNNNTFAKIFRL
jgi:hypothetical protein